VKDLPFQELLRVIVEYSPAPGYTVAGADLIKALRCQCCHVEERIMKWSMKLTGAVVQVLSFPDGSTYERYEDGGHLLIYADGRRCFIRGDGTSYVVDVDHTMHLVFDDGTVSDHGCSAVAWFKERRGI